jgi:hypothetical protein
MVQADTAFLPFNLPYPQVPNRSIIIVGFARFLSNGMKLLQLWFGQDPGNKPLGMTCKHLPHSWQMKYIDADSEDRHSTTAKKKRTRKKTKKTKKREKERECSREHWIQNRIEVTCACVAVRNETLVSSDALKNTRFFSFAISMLPLIH